MNRNAMTTYAARGLLGLGLAVAAGDWLGGGELLAQVTQGTGARDGAEQETLEMQRGTVKELLKNDRDDVDGLLLSGGVRVHFPPHVGGEVTEIVKVGDSVEVEGVQKTTPKGERVFEARTIAAGGKTVKVEPPKPPKHGPKGRRDEPPMNAAGKVKEYATNPHGDVDGLILADGAVVKFPPHQSDELQALVAVGDAVKVEGRRHETPKGEVHLHADRIEGKGGKSIEREGPKGPKHGPGRGPATREEDGPTNADLLRELRAIRRLLEAQAK